MACSRQLRSSLLRFSSSFVIFALLAIPFACAAPSVKNYDVCTTNECHEIATKLKNSMDKSVEACDDFYQHMCGQWIKKHPIPKTERAVSNFHSMNSIVTHRIKDILESPIQSSDIDALKKAKNIYKMCMDTRMLDSAGLNPIKSVLSEFGEWPITIGRDQWNPNKDISWQNINNEIARRYMIKSLFVPSVMTDTSTMTTRTLTLTGPSFYFTGNDWLYENRNGKKMKAYQELIEDVAQEFARASNRGASREQIRQDAIDLINFERRLWHVMNKLEKYTNPKLSIWFLQSQYDYGHTHTNVSKINWHEAIQSVFEPSGLTISHMWDFMIVQKAEYFRKLADILNETTERTIVNYVLWSFVRKTMYYTNSRIRDITFKFNKVHYGMREIEPRWENCVSYNLDAAISYEYVKRHFPQEKKKNAMRYMDEILSTVRKQISEAKWMEPATKQAAIDKVDHMITHVGYPNWYSDSSINDYYKNLTVTSNYFKCMMDKNLLDGIRHLKGLKLPIDKQVWPDEPTVINSFYDPNSNVIIFTAGILQDPLFNVNRPDVMNYATIASFIGHEVSHAYDNIGRQYDKSGKYKDWWSWNTLNAYNRKSRCFVNQYNRYTVPELEAHLNRTVYVDGQLSLGENIADSAGVVAAFAAYKNNIANKMEIRLPGLEEYSSDQLFFMSYGNLYCENVTPAAMELSLNDPHPRGRSRVRGSFSNMREFSNAFNCPLGSPMNPEVKCTLWS